MREIIETWNKGREYALAGVRWKLDATSVDGNNFVGASVQEIASRLGQRVKAQLDSNGVSDLEYARNVKPRVMALALALAGKAERALRYSQGLSSKSRKKAA
jgi:hypothetical protein